jgi:hypothetical protein
MVPPIKGWPDIEATDVLIDRWANEYADATNTGIITHRTPAIDVDVLDSGVADELQELAERMIGKSAVRTGRAPKRAMLFRADKPLSKISTPVFVSPDGRAHKVETGLGPADRCPRHAPRYTSTVYMGAHRTRLESQSLRTAAIDRREGERIHYCRLAAHDCARLDTQEES